MRLGPYSTRFLSASQHPLSEPWQLHLARAFSSSTKPWAVTTSPIKDAGNDDSRVARRSHSFSKAGLESLLKRRLFYTPSYEIYKGFQGVETSGLYDYGPPGCLLQANIVDLWRKQFVLEENMLEVDCPSLTPYEVLKTSGHVDKFSDYMCKDPQTGAMFRADHLIKDALEARLGPNLAGGSNANANSKQPGNSGLKEVTESEGERVQEYREILAKLDSYNDSELARLMQEHKVKSPVKGGELEPPFEFNLMFETGIGPGNGAKGYLRPETAQGQFANFQKLYEFNGRRMPFASASIGKCFRNEISPRSGLLRVREFLLAEVEHFVDPASGKQHERFEEVKHLEMSLLDRETQAAGRSDIKVMPIGDAVGSGIVHNQTLGYFLARIQLFLYSIGVDPGRLRFRQHMSTEMAHYASDCWDAELLTSYGWIECVGCADRSAFDLSMHSQRTGQNLTVQEPLQKPITVREWSIQVNNKALGTHFRQNSKAVQEALQSTTQEKRAIMANEIEQTGSATLNLPALASSPISLDKSMVTISLRDRTVNTREYTPNVIEPSFGIGRILYCLLEHVFWTRPDQTHRGVLSFPTSVAPTKVVLLPIVSGSGVQSAGFTGILKSLSNSLRRLGITNKIDGSGTSIGKKYIRNDELGTPLAVTVDYQTIEDGTVTLRERDSTMQVRGEGDVICQAIKRLADGEETWEDVYARLPKFESTDNS